MVAGDRKSWTNLSEQYCVTRFSDELLKRCRKVVDVVEGDPGKMEQVKNAFLSCCEARQGALVKLPL